MNAAIQNFLSARERYEDLEKARIRPRTPEERERFYIELMRAWLDVRYHAEVVAGLRSAEGIEFAQAL